MSLFLFWLNNWVIGSITEMGKTGDVGKLVCGGR